MEAVTPTTYRFWEPPAKASNPSEQRDWYAEFQAFANEIDADVQSISPLNVIVHPLMTETSTAGANGTALKAALAFAKTRTPTATKQITIVLSPGIYDLGTDTLELDTDYIHLACSRGASKSDMSSLPVWSNVRRAGARITSNNTSDGVLMISASHTFIVGIDTKQSVTTTAYSVMTDCPTSLLYGPIFIDCSFGDYGIYFGEACSNSVYRCHSEGGFGGYATGYFDSCSAAGLRSFQYVEAVPTRVINCVINQIHFGSDDTIFDDTVFEGCRFYGDRIFAMNPAAGGGDSTATRFVNCSVSGASMFGSNLYSIQATLKNCVMSLTSALYLGDEAVIDGCTIDISVAEAAIIYVDGESVTIFNNRLSNTDVDGIRVIDTTDTWTLNPKITGNIITNAGDGIDTDVVYSGSNLINEVWVGDIDAGDITTGTLNAARLPNTAVTPGSYTVTNITVDATGRITAAASGSASDITTGTLNAARLPNTAVTPGAYTVANVTIDATGRITAAASGSASDLTTGTLDAARLPNTAVTPGSYIASNITVDAAGRITAAAGGIPAYAGNALATPRVNAGATALEYVMDLWVPGAGAGSMMLNNTGNSCAGATATVLGELNSCTGSRTLVAGRSNTVTGSTALVVGTQNNVTADYTFTSGYLNVNAKKYAAVTGYRAGSHWFASHVFSNGYYSGTSIAQNVKLIMSCATSGTTPGELAIDPDTAVTTENVTLPNNSIFSFTVRITGTTDSRESKQWIANVIMSRLGTSTTLTASTVTEVVDHGAGTDLDTDPVIAMSSTTPGRLQITVVGTTAGETYAWTACADGEVITGLSAA